MTKVDLTDITTKKTVFARDVYGCDTVKIPAGYEWTGEFRVPERIETEEEG